MRVQSVLQGDDFNTEYGATSRGDRRQARRSRTRTFARSAAGSLPTVMRRRIAQCALGRTRGLAWTGGRFGWQCSVARLRSTAAEGTATAPSRSARRRRKWSHMARASATRTSCCGLASTSSPAAGFRAAKAWCLVSPGWLAALPWAQLLQKTFAIDVLTCNRCGGLRTCGVHQLPEVVGLAEVALDREIERRIVAKRVRPLGPGELRQRHQREHRHPQLLDAAEELFEVLVAGAVARGRRASAPSGVRITDNVVHVRSDLGPCPEGRPVTVGSGGSGSPRRAGAPGASRRARLPSSRRRWSRGLPRAR